MRGGGRHNRGTYNRTVGARRAAGGAGGTSGIPVWGSESESSSELEISSQLRAVPVMLDGLSLTGLPSASMYGGMCYLVLCLPTIRRYAWLVLANFPGCGLA